MSSQKQSEQQGAEGSPHGVLAASTAGRARNNGRGVHLPAPSAGPKGSVCRCVDKALLTAHFTVGASL